MEAIVQVIKGQDIQDGDAAYLSLKSLLKGNALQVFQNKEASQEVKDSVALTKCLADVTKHYGIPYQWKLDFEKEGFDSSASMLKEFLDMCVHLEEAELQKPLRKTIACARKEHDKGRKERRQVKPKLHHERHHSSGNCHQGKQKKKYCEYH
eukprot:1570850-Ditylum_brightwellii.AAC.1